MLVNPKFGGVAGYSDSCEISSTEVSNINISANITNDSYFAGVIGCAGDTKLRDIVVRDLTVKVGEKSSGQMKFAGMVSYTNTIDAEEANAYNINIDAKPIDEGNSYSTYNGGIVAVCNNIDITETIVDSLQINVGKTGYASGGIAGVCKNKIENGITGSIQVKNIDIDASGSIGGIAGINMGAPISDVNIDNLTIDIPNYIDSNCQGASGCIGGIVGVDYGGVTNSTINNININTNSYQLPFNIGGIVGVANNSISNIEGSKINIKDLDTPISCTYNYSNFAGGAVGIINKTLSNVNLTDVEIKINRNNGPYMHIGGLAGIAKETVESSSITNLNMYITDNMSGNTNIGGIAGIAENIVTDCTVNNPVIEINSINSINVGGIAGLGLGFKNNKIIGEQGSCIINNSGYSQVGGIVGTNSSVRSTSLTETCTIENCSISNVQISNEYGHTGGIARSI